MSGFYCGQCRHLDPRACACTAWGKKLCYTRITGWVSTTVYEKCRECRDYENQNEEGAANNA